MYAIIDIETTGGNPARDKITELAVFIHDGTRIVEEFSTLINPERRIPPFISRMTGITDAMVMNAPKFYEIARQLVELTRDKIFVAHNATFDYNFIRNEFRSLGYDYNRKQLCTYKLSRKLLPGLPSYGLSKLCKELHIVNNSRHRAAGDAMATAVLFDILLEKHPEGFVNGFPTMHQQTKVPIPDFLCNLPEETGIYYLLNQDHEIVYIGKSRNIRKRAVSHFSSQATKKALELATAIKEVDFQVTGSELGALLLESDEIKKHQPIYNRRQRRSFFNFGLFSFKDEKGYLNIRIDKTTNSEAPYTTFSNREQGREYLFELIGSFQLCQNLCGLFGTTGACFHYAVKQCQGACIGMEPAGDYNARVQKALHHASMPANNLLIIDRGRHSEEKFMVLIKGGKIHSMGYAETQQAQALTPAHIEDLLHPATDNRDARLIVSSFIRNKRVERTVPF
ncbi:MAG TPA: exonuclease [Bacteroidales bacterium]|nr:exonuclease [Bacteroidales bacterium]